MDEPFKDRLKDRLLIDLWQDPNYEIHQMQCPEIVIEQVSADLYNLLLAQATAAGAQFNGNQVQWHNCTLSWAWDAESQTLRATCMRKPFFVSCAQIQAGIMSEVQKAKSGI